MIEREDIATQGQLMYVYSTSQKFLQERGELSVFDGNSIFEISTHTEALRQIRPRSLGYLGVGAAFAMQYEADDGPESVDSWPAVRFIWLPADTESPYLYQSVSIIAPPLGTADYVTTRHNEIRYVDSRNGESAQLSQQIEQSTKALLDSIEIEAETGANLLTGEETSALRGIMHALMRQTPEALAAMKYPSIG